MFYSNKSFSLITSSLMALGFATQAMAGSIGIVDKDKVVTSYPKAQQAAEQLKKDEEKVHKLIESSNKQYEEAKTAHKPPAELQGLQQRLQGSIDTEVKRIQATAQTLEKDLEKEIDDAIKAEATAAKVDAVFMKQAVLVGGTDLTSGVVKRLASSGASANK
ncbi:MAG: OmpH family outer membrane protein [Cyanobacteria bacterium SZAS-4]|nr:OmpH family outer membrane protein [Cyanobacteria bacterium SZAS-4]